MSVLIKKATLLSGKAADILIEGNKIAKIAPSIAAKADEKIDASRKLRCQASSTRILMRACRWCAGQRRTCSSRNGWLP